MTSVEKINRVYNVRSRLRKRPRDVYLSHIAENYGLRLQWLELFSAGKTVNPHTRLLDKLEAALDDIASRP
jgi:hypothetical protein